MSPTMRKRRRLSSVPATAEFDRLSSMPEDLIHQIMSLLPSRAVKRMSSLSKQFHSTFVSFPVLDFNYSTYSGTNTEFAHHVVASLRRRSTATDLHLQRLTLKAPSSIDMSELVYYALMSNVREMIIICSPILILRGGPLLPYSIFQSTSLKKLTLSGFRIEQPNLTIASPHLEELTLADSLGITAINISCPKLATVNISLTRGLTKIHINDNTAESLQFFSFTAFRDAFRCTDIVGLASCKSLKSLKLGDMGVEDGWFSSDFPRMASLESLSLKRCSKLKNIVMRSERIESVKLVGCPDLRSVYLDARSLRRFGYRPGTINFEAACRIDLTKCPNLRELAVIKGKMAEPADVWAPNFEFLERMELSSCRNVRTLKLEAKHLTHLKIESCQGLVGFDINARNLVHFTYEGKNVVSSFCNESSELFAQVRFHSDVTSLKDFLTTFGYCKKLLLIFNNERSLIHSSDLRSEVITPLLQLRHLSINLVSNSSPISDIFDTLLWLVPRPAIISIRIGKTMNLELKYYYSYNGASHSTQCCSSFYFKCWRHDLTSVEIKGFAQSHERDILEKYFVSQANNVISVKHS